MRKIIVIIGFLAIACGCSKDEVTASVTPYTYVIVTVSDCPIKNTSVRNEYIVSQTTYDRVMLDFALGTSCFWMSFKDTGLNVRKGYVNSMIKCTSCSK
jgi:hypothetical protein